MFTGRLLHSRHAREAEDLLEAAEHGQWSPRAQRLAQQLGTATAGAVQGAAGWHPPPPAAPLPASGAAPPSPAPATPPRTPLLRPAPSSPFPPPPVRVPHERPSPRPADSMGRPESSATDQQVLEALLPLLPPSSGGLAADTAAPPGRSAAGKRAGGASGMRPMRGGLAALQPACSL